MRISILAAVAVAALAIGGGSIAIAGSGEPTPTPTPGPTVEEQLAQVEAQVDDLVIQYSNASDTAQEPIFIQIGALQDQRYKLCSQLTADSPALDLYC